MANASVLRSLNLNPELIRHRQEQSFLLNVDTTLILMLNVNDPVPFRRGVGRKLLTSDDNQTWSLNYSGDKVLICAQKSFRKSSKKYPS